MKVEYSGQGLSIINFNKFFEHYENIIIDDLAKYSLLSCNYTLGNKDVKKIIYHHLIKIIIDEFIWNNKSANKLVMIFNTNTQLYGITTVYFGEKQVIQFLKKFVIKLENMIPIRIIIVSKTLDEQLMINACLSKIKKVSKKQYTFQKIKLFAKRYELTYLNDNYLNCLKTKQVLI